MRNKLHLLLVTLCVFLGQANAMSFINNITVQSDILATMFFDEVLLVSGSDLLNFSVPNTRSYEYSYNTQKCISQLQAIVNNLPSRDVLPYIDAWGKIPSGILIGNLHDLGNYEQCLRAFVDFRQPIGLVRPQYCYASIPLIPPTTSSQSFDTEMQTRGFPDMAALSKIFIGICVPDSCDPSVLKIIFQKAANKAFNGALAGIGVDNCSTNQKPAYEAVNISGIVVFSFIGLLMVSSTAYDVITEHLGVSPIPVLLAFSVISNGRKLFAINTKKNPNNIDCLTGIRIFSMAWVIMCHGFSVTPMSPLINLFDLKPWLKEASSMFVIMGNICVDSFLFMSGLLVAWLGFRELEKKKALNIPLMYLHRFIRLTPSVAAVILFYVSLNQYFGNGPVWNIYKTFHDDCRTYWWSTLLYVQNYVNPNKVCIDQSWYLSVDTQLYVLSPLILIPFWKWGKKFAPVVIILGLLSTGCVIATYFKEGYTTFMGMLGNDQGRLTYMATHTRYPVWLIGVGLGYFMFINKRKSMRPPQYLQLIGWICCFLLILVCIYAPYFTLNSGHPTTVLQAAMFEALRRPAWGIALSWVVFASHFGFGGVVNTVLSHPFWQPLGRLTYSLYLVHLGVQIINYGITRTEVYFSNYREILSWWSTFGIALMVAIILTLAFESPILVLEKALLGYFLREGTPRQEVQNRESYVETRQEGKELGSNNKSV